MSGSFGMVMQFLPLFAKLGITAQRGASLGLKGIGYGLDQGARKIGLNKVGDFVNKGFTGMAEGFEGAAAVTGQLLNPLLPEGQKAPETNPFSSETWGGVTAKKRTTKQDLTTAAEDFVFGKKLTGSSMDGVVTGYNQTGNKRQGGIFDFNNYYPPEDPYENIFSSTHTQMYGAKNRSLRGLAGW